MSARPGAFARRPFGEDGASAVEFALVAPLMLTMLFGIFQFGWMQHSFSSVRSAMDGGARALLIDPNLTQSALQNIVTANLTQTANTNVTVSLVRADVAGGTVARLSARYVTEFGVPGLASVSLPYEITKTVVLKAKP